MQRAGIYMNHCLEEVRSLANYTDVPATRLEMQFYCIIFTTGTLFLMSVRAYSPFAHILAQAMASFEQFVPKKYYC